jgi:hypothetical protein
LQHHQPADVDDRRSRIVSIALGVPRGWVEVADA